MGTDREGDIMQLTNTTDYAIRIVCYLASENKVITTAELIIKAKRKNCACEVKNLKV